MKSELRLTVGRIDRFIRKGELEMGIKADQKKCRILGESDLQACVNHRLRKYLIKEKATENWYILNEHHLKKVRYMKSKSQKKKKKMKKKSYRPDIVIACKRKDGTVHPKFIIELKEFKNPSSPSKLSTGLSHDLNKMVRSLKKIKKIQTTHDTNLQCYIIWCVSEPRTRRPIDPKKIQAELEEDIKKRKRGRVMNITPIVINAFYGKKSNTKTNSLKVIHDLKKVQLY